MHLEEKKSRSRVMCAYLARESSLETCLACLRCPGVRDVPIPLRQLFADEFAAFVFFFLASFWGRPSPSNKRCDVKFSLGDFGRLSYLRARKEGRPDKCRSPSSWRPPQPSTSLHGLGLALPCLQNGSSVRAGLPYVPCLVYLGRYQRFAMYTNFRTN